MRVKHITAILLSLSLCTCTKETPSRTQISLRPVSAVGTKGYVEGSAMEDTSPQTLQAGAPLRSDRTVTITSWLYPQKGEEYEYFNTEVFSKSSDGLWHRDPSVYWPLGGRLDFIAYSSSIPFPDGNVKYDRYRSTESMRLQFDRSLTQDDVLFSSALDMDISSADGNVPMTFKHSQAWIQFRLHSVSPAYDNIVKIHKLTLVDVYTTGLLEVEHPFGYPEGSWSFRYDVRENTAVDDVHGVYGTFATTDISYLDMLIPEQQMKDIILTYSYTDSEPIMEYRFKLPSSYWLMGMKYIYEISFGPREITIHPTVENWDTEENGTIYIPDYMKQAANGHEYIDLGLRRNGKKILFATKNIDADEPQDFGTYFAWGDTEKRYDRIEGDKVIGYSFDWQHCPYHVGMNYYDGWQKYCFNPSYGVGGYTDDLTTLQTEDDAASVLWGGNWRMPDKSDFEFLNSLSVTSKWTDNWNSTGIKGRTYTGKGEYAGSSIFLPATGYLYDTSTSAYNFSGRYWTRDLGNTNTSEGFNYYFGSGYKEFGKISRSNGLAIRPVLEVPE